MDQAVAGAAVHRVTWPGRCHGKVRLEKIRGALTSIKSFPRLSVEDLLPRAQATCIICSLAFSFLSNIKEIFKSN